MQQELVGIFNADIRRFRDWSTLLRDPDWRQQTGFSERVRAILARIPPLERDIIELRFTHGKAQPAIARMLAMTQQGVSCRLMRAHERLQFMLEQPDVTAAQMRVDLTTLLPDVPRAVALLCDFAETSNQSATARNLGVRQQLASAMIRDAVRRLSKQLTPDAAFYAALFERLLARRNIFREAAPRAAYAAPTPARHDGDRRPLLSRLRGARRGAAKAGAARRGHATGTAAGTDCAPAQCL